MVFNNKGKGKKENWRWGTEKIKEVKTFKYLGFTFNTSGNYRDHINELRKKDKKAAGKVWEKESVKTTLREEESYIGIWYRV